MKKTYVSIAIFIGFLILITFKINAANVTWLAAVNGNWNDGTKWSGGIAPGVNDTAVIDVAGTYTVTLNVSASVAKIVLGGASGKQTLSSSSTTLTIANASVINVNGFYAMTSATLNGAGSLQNDGVIQLNNNNNIGVPLNNNDSIYVRHQTNNITGTFTTTAASVILMNGALSHSTVTFSNGFTNNGLIKMTSATSYYSYLTVTAGVLVNASGGTIQSDPNPTSTGYHRIDGRLDNQGTMNINYTLKLYSTATGSNNSGTLNIAAGKDFYISSGVWNYDGGTVSSTGRLYFENATGKFNTAVMPLISYYFTGSTLASNIGSITASKKIQLGPNNVISANMILNDTLEVMHQTNSVTGIFSTTTSAVLLMDGIMSHSTITFSSGFINNGLIKMTSATTYYSYLTITSGVLTNASGATIQCDPNPSSVGYYRIDGRLDNQGTMNINYTTRLYSTVTPSTNTGTLNIASGQQFIVYSGAWTWNGGTALGTGQLSFVNSTGNFNTPTMPNWETNFTSSTLASTQLPVTSSRVINIHNNNTISAAIYNTDTIKIHHSTNSMTGALTTATSSVIWFDGLSSHSVLTVSSGFTNNGKILFDAPYYYGYLTVTTGVLINASTGMIITQGNPYSVGYYRIDAAINNQGLINVNYKLRHYTNAGPSNNTGTISILSGQALEVYSGVWHWDGGTASGTGLLAFYNFATGSFNTATMPAFETYFNQSTLASALPAISNSKKIRLAQNNAITANLQNTDSVLIQHSGNSCSGNFSNTSASVLWFDGVESNSLLTFSNGFTNNGKILFDAAYYYGEMTVSAGVLINAATGIIKTQGNPYAVGYYRMNAAVNNLGNIDVNYLLYHYTNAGASHNTGNVNIAATREYRIYNGTWHWDGGTATGTGLLSFYSSATGSFNTAAMPPFITYFSQSTLASTLPAIANSKKIRLGQNNNVTANLQNTDSILVQHSSNSFTGNFSNTSSSLLWFDGVESNSLLTFSNGFTNNGKILFDAPYYYGEMTVTAGVLNNAATGIIKTQGNPYAVGYYRLNAAVNNLGTIDVNYLFYHYTNAGASHTTGTVNIAAGKEYRIYQGQWHWDGGTATGTGLLSFYSSATGSFNTATMPPLETYFSQSTLTSTLPAIANSKKIRLGQSNNFIANLQNTDSILVQHSSNSFTGNFTNTAASVLWFDGVGSNSIISFSSGFTNNGKILFDAGYYYGDMTVSGGTLTNASTGKIITQGNPYAVGYYVLNGNISNDGVITINYKLNHTIGSFINNSGGFIKGSDYLNTTALRLVNFGTIAPGASPGILQVNAKVKNENTSNWNIEIGGLTAGTQHDQIDNNFANTYDSINGTLNISLINGFIPNLGDSVIIEKHVSSVGTFAGITGQPIPGGLYWNIFYRSNRIVLRAGNPPNLDIVSTSGPNGAISPSGTTSVVYNGSQLYNFLPATNYQVDSIYVDGVYAGNSSSYTFSNVIVNHTIHVTFKLITWTITTSTFGNGIINPSGVVVANQGTSPAFNITADPCNILDSVIVDGSYFGTPSIYTFNNISANHTIYARFSMAPHITGNGSLTFCTGITRTLDAGSGFSAYSWSTGATTQTINVTTSGTYTCTITGSGGCTSSTNVVVTVNPLPVVTFSDMYPANNNHVCVTEGGLNLSISGFGQPVGGGYSGNGVSGCNSQCVFTPAAAGTGNSTITYSYTDGNGCTNTASQIVTVDQNATVNAGPASMVLCNTLVANLSGSIGGSASSSTWSTNGSGTFGNIHSTVTTYTLSSADSTAGTVTLTLSTDNPAGPCDSVTDQIILYYNPDAVANAGPTEVCSGFAVSVSGSVSGYAANPHWTSSGTGTFVNANAYNTTYNASLADSAAGFVFLILTPIDPNGNCTFTADSMKVYFDPQYSVNAGSDVIICNQSTDTVNLFGVSMNVQFITWSTAGSGTFGNLHSANTYYVLSASDKSNGYIALTITSDDPAGPCSYVSDNLNVWYRYAIADAGADICGDTVTSFSGSVATNTATSFIINYVWTTNGSGNLVTNINSTNATYNASNADLANGNVKMYFKAVDQFNDCIYNTDSMTIWFNHHYSINAGPDADSVCSNSILSLNANAANVQSFTWSTNGDGSFGNSNSLNTTYTPGVNDTTLHHVTLYLTSDDPAGACAYVIDSIQVYIKGLPHATAGTNSPVCAGNDLDLTASGGVGYLWSGPNAFSSTDQNIIRTPSTLSMNGTYTVTVTDVNSCTQTASTVATVSSCGCTVPTLAESHTNATCNGSHDGTATVTVESGIGAYFYVWSNGASLASISGLSPGVYVCTVSAGPGCTDVISVFISEPLALNGAGAVTPATCKGTSTGSIDFSPSGGTSPYNFLWNNGNNTEDVSGLKKGTYTVTITDVNGCTKTKTFFVAEPAKLLCNIYRLNIRCGGTNKGNATASPSGGTTPYSYVWSTGETTMAVYNLIASTYTCTVTDAHGCSFSKTFSITQNPQIVVVVTGSNTTLYNGNDGSATASVSGGIPPYNYYWSTVPHQTTQTATGLNAGFYKARVTDALGCTKIGTVTISQPAPRISNDYESKMDVYPNPASDHLFINFTSKNPSSTCKIELIDAEGRIILREERAIVSGINSFELNISKLPKGVFILKLIKADFVALKKIVVQ